MAKRKHIDTSYEDRQSRPGRIASDHRRQSPQRKRSAENRSPKRMDREKSPVNRKPAFPSAKSSSRYSRNEPHGRRSNSPTTRKVHRISRSPRNQKSHIKANNRRSKSRSLSYSPARLNPDKYREIMDTEKRNQEKSQKAGPVVKLLVTNDRESSESRDAMRNRVDEILQIDQDKDLNRLKALKSELKAKAKESLEKKIVTQTERSDSHSNLKSGRSHSPLIEPGRAREMEIVAQAAAISTKEKRIAKGAPYRADKPTENEDISNASGETTKDKKNLKLDNDKTGKARKSRSPSRSSQRYVNK